MFTPNIGLYIPNAGQTNYNDAFASGMLNLDQHDHTGGPNKGLPISSSGLANFSVTYNKLNSNVVDPTTGIGVNSTPGSQNQLQLLGIINNLFQLASVPGVGFVAMNGSTVAARTFQNSSTITWTNPAGVSGNPSASVNIGGLSPVVVANGGTGDTSFNTYGVICGGTTSTGNLQQVSGLGSNGQFLTSNGSGTLPTWRSNFVQPTKPAFAGYFSSDSGSVTGDGTAYQMNFDSEYYDQAGNFVTGTGSGAGFTAPFTAIYLLSITLIIASSGGGSDNQVELDFYYNGSYEADLTPIYTFFSGADLNFAPNISATMQVSLNSGDVIYPVLTVSGGSKSVKVKKYTQFTGVILC